MAIKKRKTAKKSKRKAKKKIKNKLAKRSSKKKKIIKKIKAVTKKRGHLSQIKKRNLIITIKEG